MLGTLGMALLGMVLWQATDPPNISGQWTSDEWGTVLLKAMEQGQYEGTYTGAAKAKAANDDGSNAAIQSGKLHLQWSATERRFKGTWGTGDAPKGKISLRLVDNEIRGAWSTPDDSQKDNASPMLMDLFWKRSGVTSHDSEAAHHNEKRHGQKSSHEKASPETNPFRKLFESIAASPPNPSPLPVKLFKDCFPSESNNGTTDSPDARVSFLLKSIEHIRRHELPDGMIDYEFTVDPLSFFQEVALLATGDKSVAEGILDGMLHDPLGPRIDARQMLRNQLGNRVKLTCKFHSDREFDYMVEIALVDEAAFVPNFQRFFESEPYFLANDTKDLYVVTIPPSGQSNQGGGIFAATVRNHRLYWGSLKMVEPVRNGRRNLK